MKSEDETVNAPLYCAECAVNFKNRKSLQCHRRKLHGELSRQQVISCTFENCQQKLRSATCLEKHLKIAHQVAETESASLYCAECAVNFKNKKSLQCHRRKLHGELSRQPLISCTFENCQQKLRSATCLEKHLKIVHQIDETESAPLKCADCAAEFKNKGSLQCHRRRFHAKLSRQPLVSCTFENCQQKSRSVKCLAKHLQIVHAFAADFYSLRLKDEDKFEVFLSDLNSKGDQAYVKKSGTKKVFYCNRSGKKKELATTTSKKRKRGSCKSNIYCPAYFSKKCLPDGSILIKGQSHHYGHEMDMAYIPLSSKIREIVHSLLLQGIQPEDIVDKIRGDIVPDPNHRDHYIKRRDVIYIANRSGFKITSQKLCGQCRKAIPPNERTQYCEICEVLLHVGCQRIHSEDCVTISIVYD